MMKRNASDSSDGCFGIRKPFWWFSLLVVVIGGIAIYHEASRLKDAPPIESARTDNNPSSRRTTVAGEVASATPFPEPIYRGKSLREWIEVLKFGDENAKAAAQSTLVAIGSPAVPALAEALNDLRSLNRAAFALGEIGGEALPVLLDGLTNGTLIVRKEIAGAGVMQSEALRRFEAEIVPALVQCMGDTNSTIRLGAVNALQSYWKHPYLVMESLVKCLSDPDPSVRASASTVVEKFGQNAGSAIPFLVRLAKEDEDSLTRTRAAESLRAIAPERAKEEGI